LVHNNSQKEVKEEIRADIEVQLLSEQQQLVDEIAKHNNEVTNLPLLRKRQRSGVMAMIDRTMD
jgi:hypothetical protein